ncbi:hypothetical protein EWM64_g2545 [Hericium alpestre]|uniref:Uncharacterized protein n=1 Tax=Hericium alpestre TaxID=135208 RepID=A0A4Z0A753_9AGAM|nr:hypothetical protein EWM64_g2545 [Hericium alpestre]
MPTPDDRRTYTHFLREFFAIFPLEDVVSLVICDDGDFGSNDFLRVFAQEHLHDITSVTFQAGKIELFCSALCERTPQPAPGRAFLLCPCLKALQFNQFDFSEISHREQKAFQENLVDLLQQRKENASPIEEVVFNYCPGMDETWINTFRVVEGTDVGFYSYEDLLIQSQ